MRIPVKDLTPGTVLSNGHTVKRIRQSGDAIAVDTFDLHGEEHETLEAPNTLYEVEAIDLTPTWSALVLSMAQVYTNTEAPMESRKTAEESLLQMARLADMYAGAVKSATGEGSLYPTKES